MKYVPDFRHAGYCSKRDRPGAAREFPGIPGASLPQRFSSSPRGRTSAPPPSPGRTLQGRLLDVRTRSDVDTPGLNASAVPTIFPAYLLLICSAQSLTRGPRREDLIMASRRSHS